MTPFGHLQVGHRLFDASVAVLDIRPLTDLMSEERNMTRVTLAAVLGLLILCQVTCVRESPPTSNTDDVVAVVEGNNQFATDLFAHLQKGRTDNLICSPYSISAALAMTSAGANGETEKQMADVLRLSLPESRLHSAFAALQQRLTSGDKKDGYQLLVANRLWGQQGYHFLSQFLQRTRAGYGAELAQVNFSQADAARQTINRWTEERTDHKIKNLIPSGGLTPDTRLVLTNAVYFNGKWMHEFERTSTTDAPFHVSPDQQVTVPTMQQSHSFRYVAADGLQILQLPYGQSKGASMLVLLPDVTDGLGELQKRLTNENLEKWSKTLAATSLTVYLPKFTVTAEFQLRDVLESMGMTLAFDPERADLSGISTQDRLFISAVIHKAFVDVNEEGTEAAAATEVSPSMSTMTEEPVVFRADHPFVFVIRDDRTDSILFLGQVLNPKSEN
jgi:serpin B